VLTKQLPCGDIDLPCVQTCLLRLSNRVFAPVLACAGTSNTWSKIEGFSQKTLC
jgi:hypothetical protein